MIRRIGLAALGAAALAMGQAATAQEEPALLDGHFSFDSFFGTIDKADAQKGLQIYKEVCSTCHALKELSYRDIEELGYSEEQAKSFASDYKVADVKDDGSPTERPALPADRFVHPFPNDQAARAANNGAAPPDLALIVKARNGGANYVYSILQGYGATPSGVTVNPGMNYNKFFAAGNFQIAMPQPLTDGAVTFADGSKNDLQHEAYYIATFLEWASNPELNERKQLGVKVLIFLVVMTGILFAAKRKIWEKLH